MHSLSDLVEWRSSGVCPQHGRRNLACRARQDAKSLGRPALDAAVRWHADAIPLAAPSGW